MWATVVQVGIVLGTFIYHRTRNPKPPEITDREVKIPRTEDGSIIPLIFGRVRVRAPVLAWIGNVQTSSGDIISGVSSGVLLYRGDAFFVLGIPFENGTNRVISMFVGEQQLDNYEVWVPTTSNVPMADLVGDGEFEIDTQACAVTSIRGGGVDLDQAPSAGGFVEFLNGNATQRLVDDTFPHNSTTVAGERMSIAIDPAIIPGYRGFMSVFLHGFDGFGPETGFNFGQSAQLPSVSFEASSYPFDSLTVDRIGLDANPADVIYHLLKDKFGKLGLPTARVDYTTFLACSYVLDAEGHGYSRVIEDSGDAQTIIDEILEQIDGVIYEDPTDGLFKLKLIRAADITPSIRQIDVDNCERIEDFAAGGWTNVPNKIRVIFTNRHGGYVEGSAVAQNQANAVGTDGLVRELVLRYMGCCTQVLADALASRELSARSAPIAKMRAIVDRSFWPCVEGEPVIVNWPEYNIANMVCRIALNNRGSSDGNTVELSLIQDFHYIYRKIVHGLDAVAPFPGSGGLLLE